MPRPLDNDDFLDPSLASKAARDRWNRQQHARAEEILADLQNGRMARILMLEMRQNIDYLGDGTKLERFRCELLNNLYALREETMSQYNAAHEPYVSPHDTRHPPMTGTHQHDHAAFEDHDHDDGIHGGDGPHTHNGDADHDHAEQHPHAFGHSHEPGKVSGPGEAVRVDGMYGRQMSATVGPVERRRLQNALREQSERNR